jgi:hypothetical protein
MMSDRGRVILPANNGHPVKRAHYATCTFIDQSGISVDRAEPLSKAACTIVDLDRTIYVGEDRGVAANNVVGAGEPCDPGPSANGCEWGKSTIQCKAPVE